MIDGGEEGSPAIPEQKILNEVLARNAGRLISSGIAKKALDKHKAKNPEFELGEQLLSVSRSGYENPREKEKVEVLCMSLDLPATHVFVPIARRIETSDGKQLIPEKEFSPDDAQEIADMVDELLEAKYTGQIPNLHEYDLNWIYNKPELFSKEQSF